MRLGRWSPRPAWRPALAARAGRQPPLAGRRPCCLWQFVRYNVTALNIMHEDVRRHMEPPAEPVPQTSSQHLSSPEKRVSGWNGKARRLALLFSVVSLLVWLTRWPLLPAHLYSFDAVNFALALDEFNPTLNQPQPPGYPLFVLEARLLGSLFGIPEITFPFMGLMICGLAVGILYLLGRRMFSATIAAIAAALLFVNPPFWVAGLTSPLRPHLALISILVAYCCWRVCSGEAHYFVWASLALGLGGGFRPELSLVLLPLWAWAGWRCGRLAVFLRGGLVLLLSTGVWIAILVMACGGIAPMYVAFHDYLSAQTFQSSLVLGDAPPGWRRMVGRAIVWNALGALPWFWALPFGWLRREEWTDWKQKAFFLVVWFLPAFLFQSIIHIADPDHALTTIPALCLLGGFCLWAAEQSLSRKWLPELQGKGFLVWIALVGNLILFFGQFPLPQGEPTAAFRGWASVSDAILAGTYESSYVRTRWVEQMTDLGLKEIHRLKSGTGKPVVVLWARDGEPVWRKICYYLPSEKVYVLEERGDPGVLDSEARIRSGNRTLAVYQGTAPVQVPIPKGGRLIWVVGGNTALSLQQVIPLQRSSNVYYTDLPADGARFRWGSFEFAPE